MNEKNVGICTIKDSAKPVIYDYNYLDDLQKSNDAFVEDVFKFHKGESKFLNESFYTHKKINDKLKNTINVKDGNVFRG